MSDPYAALRDCARLHVSPTGCLLLSDAHAESLRALLAERDALREALTFYAEPTNWHSPSRGFLLQYDPTQSPVQKDCGDVAKQALRAATPPEGHPS